MGKEYHHDHDGSLGLPVKAEPHDQDGRHADDRQRRDKVSNREQAAPEKERPVHGDRGNDGCPATNQVTAQRTLDDGLDKIDPERPGTVHKPRGDTADRREDDLGNPKSAHHEFPYDEYRDAEDQR